MSANRSQSKPRFFSRPAVWLVLVCIVAAAGISYATMGNRFGKDPLLNQPVYEVQQGPLTISVVVSGTIQAREKVIIKNELEGASTILYLVPEGARVKKGDLLVELDASALVDQKVEQQIKVQNAEAAYINARENLAIVESQAKSDIDKAKLTYDFAVQDLKKYQEGEFPKLKNEALAMIKQREEELSLAKDKVKWSEILFNEKYLSQTELDNDKLAATRAQIQLELAKADSELLEKYTYKRQIAQLTSDVEQAKMALDRTERQANANIVQASADLQAKLSEFDQQKSKLAKIEDQIAKAKIYAPMDGLVVYATSVQMNFRGNNEPLQEGQQVRERQELIHLPTTSSYIAEVKVPESSLEKIRIGLPVRITVDALPGVVFTGKVISIAPLPNAQSMFMNPDLKVYDTQISIDGNGNELRSGMGCQAEIIVDYFPDATYIPLQAVLRVGDKPTVFVANGTSWEPRAVDLGLDNNRLAQIKSGLKKGERVLLTPPLSSAEVSDEERFKEATDIPKILNESNQNPAAASQSPSRGEVGPPSGAQSERPAADMENAPQEGRPDEGRRNRENLTPEQREQMRQRFQNMSPEEREAMRRQFRQNREQSPGEGGPRREQ
ncbi:MAG TPA: efflux RND transporter periplasmic adaptor subunit [bacterium]|nr:efflux RND transporter periplasmic adaptor subunit [bacterium]HQL62757.1 efflux RND transporter periplasmic adaptor subunit [bacterium]